MGRSEERHFYFRLRAFRLQAWGKSEVRRQNAEVKSSPTTFGCHLTSLKMTSVKQWESKKSD